MAMTYERPVLFELGGVIELTQMPSPPGKSGVTHDGSQFLTNFSCVSGPGNCGHHNK
jgi:hypothetical protein